MKTPWLFLLVAYSSFIFYLLHQPSLPVPALFPHQDKLFHATAYAGLAFLAINYFKYQCNTFRIALVVSFGFYALYGASDEWHQSFVEVRDADGLGWLAHCFGAFLVLLAYKRLGLFE